MDSDDGAHPPPAAAGAEPLVASPARRDDFIAGVCMATDANGNVGCTAATALSLANGGEHGHGHLPDVVVQAKLAQTHCNNHHYQQQLQHTNNNNHHHPHPHHHHHHLQNQHPQQQQQQHQFIPNPGRESLELLSEDSAPESWISIAVQVFIPFLIAGLGMVFAGLVFDRIQHWRVFEEITELVILVPALLGLKGNLEMTLASRLCTQANLGHMDSGKQKFNIIVGNLVLIQSQAIVVGFLGAMVAVIMGGIKSNEVRLDHVYLLCASSLVTVSIASFVLGIITAAVISFSRRCHINPDNVATPIAASLGDITSLALLSWVATLLYEYIGIHDWLAPVIIGTYILAIPLWVWTAKRNPYTRDVLYNGWTPVVGAMLISSMGGLILDFMVSRFEGIAVFQPVINGVGGNLVAVQASRISTALHKQGELGVLLPPRSTVAADVAVVGGGANDCGVDYSTAELANDEAAENELIFISPMTSFFGKGVHARTTRVLMSMVVPGHIIFIYTIDYLKGGDPCLNYVFVFVYLCAAVLQVATLLYLAYIMIHWMWKRKIDPDNSAIPYLTSIGDLLGISLLAIAFQFLDLFNVESDEPAIGNALP